MFGEAGLIALRMVLFFTLLLISSSNALASPVDSKAKGLAHYIMAVCHDLNGENGQAISEYQKSVKFDGMQSAPRVKLGAYYLRIGDLKKAAVQLETVEHLSPQESQARYLLALIYSSEHKYDQAALEYEIILKNASQNDPANTDSYMYLGQLYYAQQKYPQAIEQFLKVVSLYPSNASALFLLGSVWADSNEQAKAMTIFRKVLQIDPDHSEALNSLGYLYAEGGSHLDEAIRMIRKAIEIDPTNGAYFDSLGWALYKKGLYTESLMALQKAESFIKDEILYDHIGDVYKALKEYRRACQNWQKSLDLDPHQAIVKAKIRDTEKCIASQLTRRVN